MARASNELVVALRKTAARLAAADRYEWGHMGRCNCGYLATTVTDYDAAEIHRMAMVREGDWREQANQYCPTSGLPIDGIISALLDLGLSIHDIKSLEWLSNKDVVRRVGRGLSRNKRGDVVDYLNAWADLLAESIPEHQPVAA